MEIKVVVEDIAQIKADAILVNLRESGYMMRGATGIGVRILTEVAFGEAKNQEGI